VKDLLNNQREPAEGGAAPPKSPRPASAGKKDPEERESTFKNETDKPAARGISCRTPRRMGSVEELQQTIDRTSRVAVPSG